MSKTIQLAEKPGITRDRIQDAIARNDRLDHYAGIDWSKTKELPPAGEIVAANDSLFVQSFFNQPLTDYAVGWQDPSPLDADLQFLAPQVPTNRRFSYKEYTHIEEFSYETIDDLRPLRGDFKTVEYTKEERHARTYNRGLRIVIDFDEEEETPDWQEHNVDKLMRRIKRNSLVRAFNLLSAAAVNNDLTWDAGSDADAQANQLRLAAMTLSGINLDHIFWGDTAWAYRFAALRGNGNAGMFSSAAMTPQQVATMLGIRKGAALIERVAESMTTLEEMVGNLMLIFFALDNPSREDPSNIKRFTSATNSGGQYATYVRQITAKLWEIVVEIYENTIITSTLGITQGTISDS